MHYMEILPYYTNVYMHHRHIEILLKSKLSNSFFFYSLNLKNVENGWLNITQ